MKTKSPRRAIRQHCVDCCLGSAPEVSLCVSKGCRLFAYRTGKRGEGQTRGPLKVIREYCLTCGEPGSIVGVRNCPIETCALHEYRFGHDPKRKRQDDVTEKMPMVLTDAHRNGGSSVSAGLGGIK